jgi:hypothetical protein
MRGVAAAVVLALSALGLGACGSSVGAADRIDKCEKIFLGGVAKGDSSASDSGLAKAIAQSGDAKATAAQLCRDAENAGVLNDEGDASIDDLRSVLEDNPQVLVPICESAFRAGIGKTADAVESYLPPGGLASLAGKYCSDLGPYINDSGFDQEALFKDRGREVLVPICVASAQQSVVADNSYPFSQADSTKIFTRVCGEAWDKGLVSSDGTTDTAAVQDLAVKITRQMVNSGEVTVRQ